MSEDMIETVAQAIYAEPNSLDGDPIGVVLGTAWIVDIGTETAEEEKAAVMTICRDAARAAVRAMTGFANLEPRTGR